MGYIRQKLRGILGKSMGYIWDIIDKFLNNWICEAKIEGYIRKTMGYIGLRL